MKQNSIVHKIWSYCDTLRDDGVSYGDYLEQITYLLFLKMADEYSQPEFEKDFKIPAGCDWQSLMRTPMNRLINDYSANLKKLSKCGGMLSKIFDGGQNKIHDQQKLKRLIDLINEEHWISESVDVKGDIYEGLLQKNAENSGAGQYFTPRSVIQAIIECIQPKPFEKIADPACGTGGFFLGALNHIQRTNKHLTKPQLNFLKYKAFHGWEIVPSTARLCLMNLFLHGIGDLQTTPEIEVVDSLKFPPSTKVEIILANPPFGITSSDIITNDERKAQQEGYYFRKDFWVTTSNKQLLFLQHIVSMLSKNGRAAVVLPDNVLFEGGAGEMVRKKLLEISDLHTILRLPTGIFYAHGVKANVVFFDLKQQPSATKSIWIYDYRTNIHHTLKKNPLSFTHLKEFVRCYSAKDRLKRQETYHPISNPEGRWRKFSVEEILSRDRANMDIIWLKDNSTGQMDHNSSSDFLAEDIVSNLESALESFKEIIAVLNNRK